VEVFIEKFSVSTGSFQHPATETIIGFSFPNAVSFCNRRGRKNGEKGKLQEDFELLLLLD
jgi:hypothetical protein